MKVQHFIQVHPSGSVGYPIPQSMELGSDHIFTALLRPLQIIQSLNKFHFHGQENPRKGCWLSIWGLPPIHCFRSHERALVATMILRFGSSLFAQALRTKLLQMKKIWLVVSTPLKKNMSQNGNLPQNRDGHKKIFELPPPRNSPW